MPRHKRLNLPHCLYHVCSRSNAGEAAFKDAADYKKYLFYLNKYISLYKLRVHAFCLMPTHFHLLLESREAAALSAFMQRLMTAYTVYFNKRHDRFGHLFQGRFKSLMVDKGNYFIELGRYIHRNPEQAGIARNPEDYEWSSFRYYKLGGAPNFLCVDETLSWFEGNKKAYADFVRAGFDEEGMKRLVWAQRFAGGDLFVGRMKQRMTLMEQEGSRAKAALDKNRQTIEEKHRQIAAEMTRNAAQYFNIPVSAILQGRTKQGRTGRARSVLVALLRETLPWTAGKIAGYMSLKSDNAVYYHLKKAETDKTIKTALNSLRQHL